MQAFVDKLKGINLKDAFNTGVAHAQANPLVAAGIGAAVIGTWVLVSKKLSAVPEGRVKDVKTQVSRYTDMHKVGDSSAEEARKSNYAEMVNAYYDIVTSFYEYGWGDSFHFAKRWSNETREESIVRHEHYLASRLGVGAGAKILDMGCGVGGPARNIARFLEAHVTGINNNQYQVNRAFLKSAKEGVTHLTNYVKGDFMNLPFEPASFDAAYAIEATCHAPDRTACFAQVFKALKPGAVFAGYEWVMTPNYNPADPEHRYIKHGIEIGDGLPDITDGQAVIDALKGAGFEVITTRDLAEESVVPWYAPFLPNYSSIAGFRISPLGIGLTHVFVSIMEALWLAPKGTVAMHTHLTTGAKTLRAGGEKKIFTPMYYFEARKPVNA